MLMTTKNANNRDYRDGCLQHISKLCRSYDRLQYPLIFSQGTDGYNLKLANDKKITALVYYHYHIMVRQNVTVLLTAK